MTTTTLKPVWDTETQEEHGGQTWHLLGSSFLEDFSVTTNAFGAPAPALAAAAAALAHIHHYPPADNAKPTAALTQFMGLESSDMLLVGNGASEFIDLVMRAPASPKGGFRAGPYAAAYMEYERAAKAAGREVLSPLDERFAVDGPKTEEERARAGEAGVTVVIHPNSPTGDVMGLDALEALAAAIHAAGKMLVVDESFMPFLGPDWRAASALAILDKFPGSLVVINSWTKLWSCPGLRIGSMVADPALIKEMKKQQTPWSVNTAAQDFTVAACADVAYLEKTWSTLPDWKTRQEDLMRALAFTPNPRSPAWVPWVFVECHSPEAAAAANAAALAAGCPVRYCKSFGLPSCIRLGVRDPKFQDVLQDALLKDPVIAKGVAARGAAANGDAKH